MLRTMSAKGKEVPLSIALRIVGEACLGLHNAHELRDKNGELVNLVHRDVSPANIMLSSSGDVKLIDFGVAKASERLAEVTRTGVLKGKVSYMAPEQVLRLSPDRRTDVWAAGVVLYRLISSRLPYEGDIATVVRQIKFGEPLPPLPRGHRARWRRSCIAPCRVSRKIASIQPRTCGARSSTPTPRSARPFPRTSLPRSWFRISGR